MKYKNRQKKLEARQKDYDRMMSGLRTKSYNTTGFRRPGSKSK